MAEQITLKLTVDVGKGDPVTLTVIRLKPAYTHLQADSSKPGQDPYDVVASALGARCTCRGFLFRGVCRHADAALVAFDMDETAVQLPASARAGVAVVS